jgi:epoxide hydrolase-like predicted phosphatase
VPGERGDRHEPAERVRILGEPHPGLGAALEPGQRPDRLALVELETGAIDITAFNERLGAALGVDPDGLADRLTREVRPDEEMLAAVRRFHDAGVATALVSNSWRASDYDLGDLFDAIVLSGEIGIRKPDPRIYRRAAQSLGVRLGDCIFVDDLGGNLKPAKALGMTTILHSGASSTIARLERLLRPPRAS